VYAISNNGLIVGTSIIYRTPYDGNVIYEATSWDNGGAPNPLGFLAGGHNSAAYAVNDLGQVVGWADVASGYSHACIWTNGLPHDLGVLPGASASMAFGVNNNGDVVGSSDGKAFLVHNGIMMRLDSLAPVCGRTLTDAWAINDAGQIVAWVGAMQSVVLTPVGKFTSVRQALPPPVDASVIQVYPNPSQTLSTVQLNVHEEGMITIDIVDALGAVERRILNEDRRVGEYVAQVNCLGLPSGAHFVRIFQNGVVQLKPLMILR